MFSIKNLTVAVDKKTVLKNVSFDIIPGTLTILMGPNGSGKSSLAYTLMGHPAYQVTQGQVIFDQENMLELPVEKRARQGIFLACQYPQEVPGVSVMVFLKESYRMLVNKDITTQEFQQKLYHAFDEVSLDHGFAFRHLNEGFSGGEKKRLEMVQLILFKPRIAILDEIDSGLDIDALKIVARAIETTRINNPQMALVVITHYQKILEHLNPETVHVLIDGSLTASGTKDLALMIHQRGYNAVSI